MTIVTKDTGGKKYAETFRINVLKESDKDGSSSNNELKSDPSIVLVAVKAEQSLIGGRYLVFQMFKEMGSAFTYKTNKDGKPTLVDK